MKFIGLILIASLASLVSSAEELHLVFGFDVATDGASGDPMRARIDSCRSLLYRLPAQRRKSHLISFQQNVSW